MRKLTKKFLRTSSAHSLRLSKCGEWLTNGLWAVRRDTIEDAELMESQALLYAKYGDLADKPDPERDGPEIDRVIPRHGPWERFERTGWLTEGAYPVNLKELFVGDKGSFALVPYYQADFLGDYPYTLLGEYDPERPEVRRAKDGGYYESTLRMNDGDGEPQAIVMPCATKDERGARIAQAIAAEWARIDTD